MDLLTLLLIAIGLSMDAFAVSICKGLSLRGGGLWRGGLIAGVWFGGFQALMPIVGYFAGTYLLGTIEHIDHWVAFTLLAIIGTNMIRESREEESSECHCEGECQCHNKAFSARKMFPLAIATSIDALAIGLSFAVLNVNIWSSALCIGITTLIFSIFGVRVGSIFGVRYKSKAELAGGVILILIGLKILIEHLFFS